MAKQGLVVTVDIDGVRDVIAAFRRLPKDANTELRAASLTLAQTLAPKVAAAGRAEGRQAALLAKTVRAQRDRLPAIVVGGTRRLGRFRQPAYGMLFGSEFGANQQYGWYAQGRYRSSAGRQYRPHGGPYWIFKTVDANASTISKEWNRAASRIIRKWGG